MLLYAFQSFYPDFMFLFSNAFPPFVAGAAFISSILALRRYLGNFKERFSQIWLGFASAMGLWFLGELCWAVYTLFLNIEIPYPSIGDVFWLGGYIPMFTALFLYVKPFSETISKNVRYAITSITLGLFALVLVTLHYHPLKFKENMVTVFIDFAYPILDLLLLYTAILGLIIFLKGKLGKPWLLISLGTISITIADILFSYTTTYELYYCGHPLELLFHFGYILLLLAFRSHRKEL